MLNDSGIPNMRNSEVFNFCTCLWGDIRKFSAAIFLAVSIKRHFLLSVPEKAGKYLIIWGM